MIYIFRLSHRISRDIRLTTHLCLCARAFLADKLYYSGQKDSSLEKSIKSVTSRFGGDFRVEYVSDPKKFIFSFKGIVIHLTMYGEPFLDKLKVIKGKLKSKDILVVVGGPKVEPWVYGVSNYNLSVTSQPISEVGALSVFLHELCDKKEAGKIFNGAYVRVVPSSKGKVVQKR